MNAKEYKQHRHDLRRKLWLLRQNAKHTGFGGNWSASIRSMNRLDDQIDRIEQLLEPPVDTETTLQNERWRNLNRRLRRHVSV